MARTSITSRSGYDKRKLLAAANAVKRARATLINSRRYPLAPPRTGGFFGTRRNMKELKVIDQEQTASAIDSTGDVTFINGVATGTDFTDRVGRKIYMKSISIRFHIVPATTSQATGNYVRLLVIYDSQTNGAAPLVADVLRSASYLSHMNLNNRDRFKILMDKTFCMNCTTYTAGALTAGSPVPKKFNLYKKLSHEVIFQGTANTVGSVATGGIFVIPIAAADDIDALAFTSRIRFEDA